MAAGERKGKKSSEGEKQAPIREPSCVKMASRLLLAAGEEGGEGRQRGEIGVRYSEARISIHGIQRDAGHELSEVK